jgi:hypothetical protein
MPTVDFEQVILIFETQLRVQYSQTAALTTIMWLPSGKAEIRATAWCHASP